jgi:hypothetical protein
MLSEEILKLLLNETKKDPPTFAERLLPPAWRYKSSPLAEIRERDSDPNKRLVTYDGSGYLDVKRGPNKGCYSIPTDRMQTPWDLLRWIRQIAGKCWCTYEHIDRLILESADIDREEMTFRRKP